MLTRYKEKFYYNKSTEALEQVCPERGWCLIPRDIPDQAGWGSKQSDRAVDVPVHCRGVGLDNF